jgi:LysM repeat protein
MRSTFSTAAFALAAFASSVLAHMEMTDPAPFRSKFNKNAAQVDFDMNAPLKSDGSDFPCKNYLVDFGTPAGDPTATWAAGSPQKVALDDKAAHKGGSCQLSLSYDGGKTFRVIKSIEGGCVNPEGGPHTFDFTVPADAKSGNAIFAWTWFNHTGNREMYMNCAAVSITGTGTSTLEDRPEIFKANINNQCKTVEETDVQFPDPGPDLQVISQADLSPPNCKDSPQPDQPADPTEPAESADPTSSTSSADSTSSASSAPVDASYSATPDAPIDSATPDAPIDSATPTDSGAPTKAPVSTGTSNVSAPATTPTGTISPTYTVKAGDICINIAKQQGVPLATLYKLNPDINEGCTNLKVGQDLNIRRRSRIMRDLD